MYPHPMIAFAISTASVLAILAFTVYRARRERQARKLRSHLRRPPRLLP
ncbi:hypothetical protein ACQKKX_06240 [Neorhizobium sp. NPDC001467]